MRARAVYSYLQATEFLFLSKRPFSLVILILLQPSKPSFIHF
jgi:hypothetical protein